MVDDKRINAIERLSSFAPLHQAKSVALIRGIQKLFPHVKQTVSFDTAFDQTTPEVIRRFALPREFHERDLKRYGFHGLSYKSIIGSFPRNSHSLLLEGS
ncbi:acetokinase family protein [Brucella lupini]|uniref:Acetokinase family protein n=1 Tax=Brucella lupini TaxID=255457 RepID=A0A256GI19_9HYPH|nr:acetokinase family protein [Brucella lupini]